MLVKKASHPLFVAMRSRFAHIFESRVCIVSLADMGKRFAGGLKQVDAGEAVNQTQTSPFRRANRI
jgi:hypothetical protein